MADKTAVYAIYKTEAQAEKTFVKLAKSGFRDGDVSVLCSNPKSTKEFAHEKHTKAPEGATTGGGAGAVTGGIVGWLAGIGAIAIPGVGPFIAAGPIMATLAGVGVGAAAGAVTGALIGMGIPEYEAKRFEGLIKSGGVLLSVHCDSSDWVKKAKEILKNTGGESIGVKGEASAEVQTESPRPMQHV